jgi:alkylated DNA nucleotide flippase Atl1
MDADVRSIQALFGDNHRYTVPPFQRPYVWEEDRQWTPLWDDIERIADARLSGGGDHHFLGAVVIKQEAAPPGGITQWSVIDGQQRLTTIQIVMSALSACAAEDELERDSAILNKLTHHDALFAMGDEQFKFWPTLTDQAAFREVMAGNKDTFVDDDRNTIHEAWVFFHGRIQSYVHRAPVGDETDDLRARYGALREAITGLLQLVTISLKDGDPSQVIFETLNARGTPLHAMDLVKNALFEQAKQQGASLEALNRDVWGKELGDTDYWNTEISQGRVSSPRSELFLIHWLSMRLGEVVQLDQIFEVFRRKILSAEGFDALATIEELNRDARIVRSFDAPVPSTPQARLVRTLKALDTTTMHPLLLLILRSEIAEEQKANALGALESFLVRRMVLGATTKAYNRLVARLVNVARGSLATMDTAIVSELAGGQADINRWPLNDEIEEFLSGHYLYGWINQRRIVLLFSEVEKLHRQRLKVESVEDLPTKLQVEHIMPQAWQANWPLSSADEGAVERREELVQNVGNLTIISGNLNASLSNKAWEEKSSELFANSMLAINKEISNRETWDEAAITQRCEAIAADITEIWPGPETFMPSDWVAPDAEYNASNAMDDPQEVQRAFESGGGLLQSLLRELANTPDERRSYAEVCEALHWERRRLPGVLGGTAGKLNQLFSGRRPWHIHLDTTGTWFIWVDSAQADVIRDIGAPKSFDWTTLDAVVAAIPDGRWTSYGDLAKLVETSPQAVANHVTNDDTLTKAYRVLGGDGAVRPEFRWPDPADTRDPRALLEAEGVSFDGDGRALQSQRLKVEDLADGVDDADEAESTAESTDSVL